MAELSTQRISTILGYRVEGEEDLRALADTLGKTNQETAEQTEQSKRLRVEKRKLSKEDKDRIRRSRRARTNQLNMNRAMEDARNIIQDNTLRLENLKLEYEQGNMSAEEYRFELQKLMQQMERLDVPMTAIPRRMRQINREMQQVGKAGSGMTKQVGRTNFAFNSMAQLLQDLPFGLIAISNNIPQAAQGFSLLQQSAGGTAGAFDELLGFIKGPGGWLVVASTMLSVFAVLIPKMDLFGSKTKEAAEANEELKSAIQSGVGDFISDLTDEQQIEALEKALDTLMGGARIAGEFEKADNQLQKLIDNLDQAAIVANKFETARTDASQTSTQASERALEMVSEGIGRQTTMNRLIREELKNRLAVAKANKLVAQSLRELGIVQEDMPELGEFTPDSGELEIETPILDPGREEFERYQERFNTLWSNITQDGIEHFGLLRDFEMRFLEEIKNDAALNEYQKEQLRTNIVERFAYRRQQIEEKNAEQINQLQDQIAQKKMQIAGTLSGTLSGLVSQAFQESKAAVWTSLALEKGFAIAQVLIKGIQESARMTMQGTANLATPGFQALGAAQLAAAGKIKTIAGLNAAAIAAQGIGEGISAVKSLNNEGAGGGGVSNASYRTDRSGFQGGRDFSQTNRGSDSQMPNEFILKDRSGEVLTKLQYAQDRQGGNNYLVEPLGQGRTRG